jgi:hypothetical protein
MQKSKVAAGVFIMYLPNSLIRLSNAVDTSFGAREVGADGPCRA